MSPVDANANDRENPRPALSSNLLYSFDHLKFKMSKALANLRLQNQLERIRSKLRSQMRYAIRAITKSHFFTSIPGLEIEKEA